MLLFQNLGIAKDEFFDMMCASVDIWGHVVEIF